MVVSWEIGTQRDDHERVLLPEPPISEDDLPPNVHLPEGEFPGGLQNRFQIVGLNPLPLEETGLVTLKVAVTTTSGTYSDEVEVHTELPWKVAPAVRNVPVERAVLLHGRVHVDEDDDDLNDDTGADVTAYDWALTPPAGSSATLTDATTQNPYFTPDDYGLYTVTVTDTTQLPGDEVVTIEIHAGTWQGAVTGQDADGRPLAAACTGCHREGGFAPDKFTPWAQTGHAEIFTDNLDTSTHYGESCFSCHTVGYDPGVDNSGFDDAYDYAAFLAADLLNNPGDNWSTMLEDFPEAAQLANIQCENCHGPQGSDAHSLGDPRISLSSDVCGVCHGEPLRHARFQQWQLSAHANYELAIDEGESGSCARCHTANGFLTWLPILLDDDPATDPTASISVSWTAEEVHPQTCPTCHDPHAIGTTTGIDTNATVRISGNTPPLIAGFTAVGVGRGAICMTCHNSRRGLRNDDMFGTIRGTSETSRAPHGSAQADIVMGQNAHLVNVGIRGNHSLVEDTCVNCHMEQTDPPELLSYALGGTNHTFFASDEICSNCHGSAFNAEGVQAAFAASLEELQDLVEEAILQLMADQITVGNVIDLDGEATITDVTDIEDVVFGESHGRQAITVTLTDGTTVGPVGMNSIDVLDGTSRLCPGVLSRCELYDFADPRLVKAGWNWNLVNNDGSRGVHNPDFALQVLDASIDALVALASDDVDAGADVVRARFSAVEGTLVSIKVKAAKGSSRAPTLILRDGSDAEVDLGATLALGRTSARLRDFEIQASGTYAFEIGGIPVVGNFRAKTAGKFPKKYVFSGTFPADETQSFDVMPGSVLKKARIKAAKGSNYQPTVESVTDKGGPLTLRGLKATERKAGFKSAVATTGATVTLTVGGTGTGSYTGSVRVARGAVVPAQVKTPKSKKKNIIVDAITTDQEINLGDTLILNLAQGS